MNNFSPDQLYDSIQARHQDIRNAEAARQAAKLAQRNNPNWLQAIVKRIVIFTQGMNAPSVKATQTSDLSPVQLGNE